MSQSTKQIPIAILIWLMTYPMMLESDFASIRGVGKRPGGLAVTLVVNWLVKPFSTAFLGRLFFRDVFTPSGPGSGAALATVVGVLVEVPVMLSVCRFCVATRGWFEPAGAASVLGPVSSPEA